MAYIAATATGFPPHYYSQLELVAALRRIWSQTGLNFNRLEQFHRNTLVDGRHLALPLNQYEDLDGFSASNGAWTSAALDLGEKIICDLLEKAGLQPRDIAHLTFNTVTGIAVPSIDARLMNRIPFSQHLRRTPLFGLGCAGGAAGIARVADYLRGYPDQAALLLSIELCSLTLQRRDISVANLISSGLFGDGGAAVLLVGNDHSLVSKGGPRVVDSRSYFFPRTEHIMGWDVSDSGFKMLLSPDVVKVVKTDLYPAIEAFLASHQLKKEEITHWIAHPGGPKVMDALEEALDVGEGALRLSRESLASVGNISSASVLIILDETLKQYRPEPGAYGLLLAMGPAFGAELVLLQW